MSSLELFEGKNLILVLFKLPSQQSPSTQERLPKAYSASE